MEIPVRRARRSFKIELSGDQQSKEILLQSLQEIKSVMGYGATNVMALQATFTTWLEQNRRQQPQDQEQATPQTPSYQHITVDQAKMKKLYVCGESSLSDLMVLANNHGKKCAGDLKLQTSDNTKQSGFWNRLNISCSSATKCRVYPLCNIHWATSSYLPNGHSHVNLKMTHGFITSGLLPSQFRTLIAACSIEGATWFAQNPSGNEKYFKIIERVSLLTLICMYYTYKYIYYIHIFT